MTFRHRQTTFLCLSQGFLVLLLGELHLPEQRVPLAAKLSRQLLSGLLQSPVAAKLSAPSADIRML